MDSQGFYDSYVPVICRIIYRIFGDSIPEKMRKNLPEVVSNALKADRDYLCRQRQPCNSSSSIYTNEHDRLRDKSSVHFRADSSDAALSDAQRRSEGTVMIAEQNRMQPLLSPGTIRNSNPSLPNSQACERHGCKCRNCSNQPVTATDRVSLKTVHHVRCDEATVINHTCLVTASPLQLLPSCDAVPVAQDRDCCSFSCDSMNTYKKGKCYDQSITGKIDPETKSFGCVSDSKKCLHLHSSTEHENRSDVLGNRRKLISSFNQLPLGNRIQRCSILSEYPETGRRDAPRESPKKIAELKEIAQGFVDQNVLRRPSSGFSADVNHASTVLPDFSDCCSVHNKTPSHPSGSECAARYFNERSAQVHRTTHCNTVTNESEADYEFKRPRVEDKVLKRKKPRGQSQGVKIPLRTPLRMPEDPHAILSTAGPRAVRRGREDTASYSYCMLHPENNEQSDKVETAGRLRDGTPVALMYPNYNPVSHTSISATNVFHDSGEPPSKRSNISGQSTWGKTEGVPTKDNVLVRSSQTEKTLKPAPGTVTWDAAYVSQTPEDSAAEIQKPVITKEMGVPKHAVPYTQTRNSRMSDLAGAEIPVTPVTQIDFSHLPKHVQARKKLLASYFALRHAVKTFRKNTAATIYPTEDFSMSTDASNAADETFSGPLDLSSTTASTSLQLSVDIEPGQGSEEEPIKFEPAID